MEKPNPVPFWNRIRIVLLCNAADCLPENAEKQSASGHSVSAVILIFYNAVDEHLLCHVINFINVGIVGLDKTADNEVFIDGE